MSYHSSSKRNPVREKLLFHSVERMKYDGLSNVDYLNVTVLDVQNYALYTQLKIHVGSRDPDYLNKNGYSLLNWII
jgi:hypothetical protein